MSELAKEHRRQMMEEAKARVQSIKAKALSEQARGRRAEMMALASASGQIGVVKLFEEAAEHYENEAAYWDQLTIEDEEEEDNVES